MIRALLPLGILAALSTAHAYTPLTYYVRKDGGDAVTCNGTVNLPRFTPSWKVGVPPRDNAPDCAWSSPMIVCPPPQYGGSPQCVVPDGSVVKIGPGKFELGYDHDSPVPGAGNCNATYCAGITIRGSLHFLGYSETETQLWATNGLPSIFAISNTTGVEIGNMELTDHDSCDKHGGPTACGPAGNGRHDGDNGIAGWPVTNLNLHDLNIHGFANEGVRIGAVSGLLARNVRVIANAEAGWDFDSCGGSGSPCSNSGTLDFEGGDIAWNGCGEIYPAGGIYRCWSQNQGGYGDGLGTGATGGNWIFRNVTAHRNASDGLDLLYHKNGGTILFDHVNAYANAGNQLKAMGTVTIRFSTIDGNCADPWAISPANNSIAYPVPALVTRYGFGGDGPCRADGISVSLALKRGEIITLDHNTIAGQGGGLVTTTAEAPGDDAAARVIYSYNIFDGNGNYQWPLYNQCRGCGFADLEKVYATYNYNAQPIETFSGNIFWGVKDDQCPGTGNMCGVDPHLVGPSPVKFDPKLLPGSPAIGAGFGCPASPTYKACNIGAR